MKKNINFDEPYIIINIPVRAMILKTLGYLTKIKRLDKIPACKGKIFVEVYPKKTKYQNDWTWADMLFLKEEIYVSPREIKYFIKDDKINKDHLIDCIDFLKSKKVSTIELLKNYKEN